MLRVLIAGCGDVGGALSRRLLDSGHRVWGLRRNAALLPSGVEGIEADLTRTETLDELPPELDAVIYSAAADTRSERAYRNTYLRGVENLIAALDRQARPALRLVFVSSTSVYTQTDGAWVDEDSSAEPKSIYQEILNEGEAEIMNSPWQSVIVRFGGIYGPGRSALIRRVLADGATCTQGLFSNRIHRDDCAGVLFHVLTLADPKPVYLGVDCEPAPICDVMKWLADRLQAPSPAVEPMANGTRTPTHRSNKRCSNRRLLDSGYRFRYPTYREGYTAVLASV